MFLVEDRRFGATYLVFTWEDPRKHGFTGDVIEDVDLAYDMQEVHRWLDGDPQPEACVGRDPDDRRHYKVFKYCKDRESAGYEPVDGTAEVFGSWSDYVRLSLTPPDPRQTDDQRWYEYLDKIDEGARNRREQGRTDTLPPPSRGNREEVAAWLAKTHLIADSAIREVWYLPKEAPPDEIRLLELNDRLAGAESEVEAIDFGVNVEGGRFRLVVADITTSQLENFKQDPSRLPPGWSLDGHRIWRRGA